MTDVAWGEYRPSGLQKACIAFARATHNKKVKRQFRQYLLQASDVYDITHRDLKMRCHVRDNITEREIVFGGKLDNVRELTLVERHLRPGCVFVDVGANCGLFSLVASQKVGEKGRVIAIEPNPIMNRRLQFNVSANGFQNVSVAECAAGDVKGTAELQVCDGDMGQSGLIAPVSGPRVNVPVRTMQDVLAGFGIGHTDVMKVDVEGFEDRAIIPLLNGPKTLWPHAILIEILHAYLWRESCIVALQEVGYKIKEKTRNDILLELSA